ncbi:TIGR03826 family flagellar region protein [Priestia taiwanensis]|uniref:Uncharacterized protein n=1 Tax=Priestia taiwanensis TaxID=1347902 RepID=A0A917AWS9_9BACI|nr:TIGR03826 family flagellar region protein [Priestia taiwanensis]MBM7364374.1 flagellar operon protein (TIGR03826 family) [Priestia taiwanensis]GGE84948.1 hypothetical protein GCM10007140_38090 [Priestia taiwanensis]
MGEVINCPKCNALYMKSNIRDVCVNCYKEEEKWFDDVYTFLRKRNNRMALIPQIVEGTGVEEKLLFKWVRAGRLRPSQFPNLGYPCEKCGTMISEGKLCSSCTGYIRSEIEKQLKEEEHQKQLNQVATYKFTQR